MNYQLFLIILKDFFIYLIVIKIPFNCQQQNHSLQSLLALLVRPLLVHIHPLKYMDKSIELIWKEGFFAKGKLIGECNILMNSKNLKGNENFFLRIAEERNPGCDIDSIRVNTPYFSNGEWI